MKAKKRRITGLYALRRLTAAWPTKNRSRANALYAVFLRHIFLRPETLRVSLSGAKKRRIQPERYTPLRCKVFEDFVKK
jgi:hypothetical protein